MKRASAKPKRRRPHRRPQRRPQPFRPAAPAITAGKFVGRKLGELSDEELQSFICSDARLQTGRTLVLTPPSPPSPGGFFDVPSVPFMDLSQYWFARYEIERRKSPPSIPDLRNATTPRQIARKMLDFAFRAFSKVCHPDKGGDHETMIKLGDAKDLLSKALQ